MYDLVLWFKIGFDSLTQRFLDVQKNQELVELILDSAGSLSQDPNFFFITAATVAIEDSI